VNRTHQLRHKKWNNEPYPLDNSTTDSSQRNESINLLYIVHQPIRLTPARLVACKIEKKQQQRNKMIGHHICKAIQCQHFIVIVVIVIIFVFCFFCFFVFFGFQITATLDFVERSSTFIPQTILVFGKIKIKVIVKHKWMWHGTWNQGSQAWNQNHRPQDWDQRPWYLDQ